MSKVVPFIAVDLDGTLAHYDEWQGPYHIGRPITAMVQRVVTWLDGGKTVKIFTNRITPHPDDETPRDIDKVRRVIENWCERHIGRRLEVINTKEHGMEQLWDDRAVGVEPNTGAMSTLVESDPFVAEDHYSPDEILQRAADTFRQRNAIYGDNWKNFGNVMAAMFPNGITLKGSEDFARWHLFEIAMVKNTRFANSGLTHKDSTHDNTVYHAMIESLINSETKPIKSP